MKLGNVVSMTSLVVLALVFVTGCGGGHKQAAYDWTDVPVDESFGVSSYLESFPAGSYTGTITQTTSGPGTGPIDTQIVQKFKVTVGNEGNLSGQISGTPAFDGSNWNNNWRHYEEHFHRAYPTMLIDLNDGKGLQTHTIIFDRPYHLYQDPERTIAMFHIDPDKYKDAEFDDLEGTIWTDLPL